MAKEIPKGTDDVTVVELKKIKEDLNHLKSMVENYQPAKTMAELTEQVHVAKSEGCDSVDATPALVKQVFRADYNVIETKVGYGIYHDVRVYIDGTFEKNKNDDKTTMAQKLEPKKA